MDDLNAQPLITGFLPFLGETLNPSQILAERLAQELSCDHLLLPVVYSQAWLRLLSRLESKPLPKFLLMLGQAGGRRRIGLERCALNLEHADVADEAGDLAQERKILSGAAEILKSTLPLVEWKDQLKSQGHAVEVSHSAGTFVCNSLYFQSLHWQEGLARTAALRSVPVLFVHVPHLPEQTSFVASAGIPFDAQHAAVRSVFDKMNLFSS